MVALEDVLAEIERRSDGWFALWNFRDHWSAQIVGVPHLRGRGTTATIACLELLHALDERDEDAS